MLYQLFVRTPYTLIALYLYTLYGVNTSDGAFAYEMKQLFLTSFLYIDFPLEYGHSRFLRARQRGGAELESILQEVFSS